MLQEVVLLIGFLVLSLGFQTGEAFGDRVIAQFDIPGNSSGLAFDGRLLWVGGEGARSGWIWSIDPNNGSIVDSIPAPAPDCIGMEWMGDRLAFISGRSDSTYLITRDGIVQAFRNPYRYMSGVTADSVALWGSTYYDPVGALVRYDLQGRILSTVPHSGRQSRDMTFHQGKIFITDLLSQTVRILTPSNGRLVRAFNGLGSNPDGLTSDGEYLYLTTDGPSKNGDKLYKISIRPEGGIRLSSLFYNFGSVVIDGEKNWTLWIYNDGAQSTRLVSLQPADGNGDIFIPNVWQFPTTIAPGDSVGLTFTFSPAFAESAHVRYGLTYDLDRVTNWVDLRGKGVRQPRDIIVRQRRIDFGQVLSGPFVRLSGMRLLEVESNGGDPLTINTIIFSNDAFSCGNFRMPFVMRSPGMYYIPLIFRPVISGTTQGTASIFCDDPDAGRIVVELTGQSQQQCYNGGMPLWSKEFGSRNQPVPQVRAMQDIGDITADGLADLIVADNNYNITAFHAASTSSPYTVWNYRTDLNPWRSGLVPGKRALSEGGDWDEDGLDDIVFGLDGGAARIQAISPRFGRELWVFDTHHLPGGGGKAITVQGSHDFNGDRIRDVYAAITGMNETCATNGIILLDGRNGQLRWFTRLDLAPVDLMRIDDITGDFITDLVVVMVNGDVAAYDGQRGRLIWRERLNVRDVRAQFILGDANRDGSQDIIVVTYTNGIHLFNGSNGVKLWQISDRQNGLTELTVAAPLGDLNGNGSPDFVVGNMGGFLRAVDGRTSAMAWYEPLPLGSAATSITTTMDFDFDGRREAAVGTNGGRLFLYSGNGRDGIWSISNAQEGNGFVYIITSRDIDGNGEEDVFGVTELGKIYCIAGSYVGQAAPEFNTGTLAPKAIMLEPAYPNPFNSTVVLPYSIIKSERIEIIITDILGREVYRRMEGLVPAGQHRLIWSGLNLNGTSAPSGYYLMRVSTPDAEAALPVQLVR